MGQLSYGGIARYGRNDMYCILTTTRRTTAPLFLDPVDIVVSVGAVGRTQHNVLGKARVKRMPITLAETHALRRFGMDARGYYRVGKQLTDLDALVGGSQAEQLLQGGSLVIASSTISPIHFGECLTLLCHFQSTHP